MKRFLLLGLMLPLLGVGLRVDAASGTCQAPSVPDAASPPVEGCAAPSFWIDTRTPEQKGKRPEAVVSATQPPAVTAPSVSATPLPPVGSGAGAPMVVDEGMGRQQESSDTDHAKMMRTAGLAAGLRGEAIREEFSSDVNYLRGYAQGQAERLNGGVRP